MIHAHKFTECAASMHEWAANIKEPKSDNGQKFRTVCRIIGAAIECGERFYLPPEFEILSGKPVTEDLKSVMKLPYPIIALLSDQPIKDSNQVIDRITVAMSIKDFAKLFALESHESYANKRGFVVLCAMFEDKIWTPCPAIGFCYLPLDETGYEIAALAIIHDRDWRLEMRDDVSDIMNLCVMLSLHNVKSVTQEIPPRLANKRSKTNKLPLYSYKVLEVAGDVWDRKDSVGSERHGVRSHMRRGHIRRLDETRKVWVRATMVHGKVPGFVDKEYRIQ